MRRREPPSPRPVLMFEYPESDLAYLFLDDGRVRPGKEMLIIMAQTDYIADTNGFL